MESDDHNSEAPFNMAIATLMRLDAILKDIKIVDCRYPIDSPEKQKSYLGLVKQFYLNSIPLMEEKKAKKEEFQELLSLGIKKEKVIRNGVQKNIAVYDKALDLKLNNLLIKLQTLLKKYFMPKGRDLRRAVANIG